jgi:hypothetical protein
MTIADIRHVLRDADIALGGSNSERLNECADALIDAICDIDTNLPELGAERPAAIAKLSRLCDAGALKDYLPATLRYINGDYRQYLSLIEPYIQSLVPNNKAILFDQADVSAWTAWKTAFGGYSGHSKFIGLAKFFAVA